VNFNLAQHRDKDIWSYNVLDSNLTVSKTGWQEEAEGGQPAPACTGRRPKVALRAHFVVRGPSSIIFRIA
jgi:hypothetical protein